MRLKATILDETFPVASVDEHADAGRRVIDLTATRRVDPGGLFAIACLAAHSPQRTRLTPPPDAIGRSLSAMRLAQLLDEYGVAHELPAFDGGYACGVLLALQVFQPTLEAVVTATAPVSEWGDSRSGALREILVDLASNIVDHARTDGFVAVAHDPDDNVVRFAIGDTGPGITPTLRRAGHSFKTDIGAVRAAVETAVSAKGRDGQGLPGARRRLSGVGGTLTILAGHALVRYEPNAPARPVHVNWRFPGTLVAGTV